MNEQIIKLFRSRVHQELNGNIMPFWLNHAMDQENGGFIGRMSNSLVIDDNSPLSGPAPSSNDRGFMRQMPR